MKAPDQDLGSGNIRRLLMRLAVPAVVGQIINLLYTIVDRIYIGHIPGVGADALTGIGLFNPILILITAFSMLGGNGGAPRAAIAMGQGRKDQAEQIMGNCFSLLMILAAVLTAIFYIFAPQLFRLFGASDDTISYAVTYGRIYVLGTVFVMIVLGMNTFITAQGFARTSMMTIVIGAILNIVLDPVLIFVFHMGVSGAAIATVFSQAVGAVWILLFLTGKKTTLKLRLPCMRLKKKVILPCLALGVSSFVMQSTESLLSVCFTSSLQKYSGDLAVGAMTVMTSIKQLITMPLAGLCQGAQPILSFNFGAGKNDRVKEAFRVFFTVGLIYTTGLWLLIMIFPRQFAGIFTPDEALIQYTVWALYIFMSCSFTNCFQNCCQQSFVALGQARISLFLACLRKLILLIPMIYLLPLFFENKAMAVFLAEPVSDVIAAAVTAACFFYRFPKILRNGPGN